MKWASEVKERDIKCTIEYDEFVGYYLYVYQNGKDIRDYLQGTLEIAKEQAFEEFGVPMNAWVQVE